MSLRCLFGVSQLRIRLCRNSVFTWPPKLEKESTEFNDLQWIYNVVQIKAFPHLRGLEGPDWWVLQLKHHQIKFTCDSLHMLDQSYQVYASFWTNTTINKHTNKQLKHHQINFTCGSLLATCWTNNNHIKIKLMQVWTNAINRNGRLKDVGTLRQMIIDAMSCRVVLFCPIVSYFVRFCSLASNCEHFYPIVSNFVWFCSLSSDGVPTSACICPLWHYH